MLVLPSVRSESVTSNRPHVDLLVDFTNSIDHEEETDDLSTRAGLATWLAEQGLTGPRPRPTVEDLALARELRDALHVALMGNHDDRPDLAALSAVAGRLPLVLSATPTGPGLRPVAGGVPGALAWILVAVNSAVADDTWRRIRICSSDECYWAFFDTTKNQSRAWCEWGCGNKIKTRNYRARQRAIATTPG
jgi:predicted RNA-binding Zn ribbon-like protein